MFYRRLPEHRLKQLALDEAAEGAIAADEFVIGTNLHDPSALEDQDAIGIPDGTETMRNDDARGLIAARFAATQSAYGDQARWSPGRAASIAAG